MYYLGIDGGGTYSRLLGISDDGENLGGFTGGSTNLSSNSYDSVKDTIDALIINFLDKTGLKLNECAAFCIGSAGIDLPVDVSKMESLLREIGIKCPVVVVNDAELILAAGTGGGPGIAVISGTGSVGYAKDMDGNLLRCGGWGNMIDDGGSGYYIGIQAVRAALMSYDGRSPETMLTREIKEHFKIKSIDEVLKFIYTEDFNKKRIAEIALIVSKCADLNDIAAKDIEMRASYELFNLVDALAKRSGMHETKIVLSGSVLLLNSRIQEKFTALVKEKYGGMNITPITEKPEMGAIYLAKRVVLGNDGEKLCN